ncbi:uncharacterized protein LOC100845520 [Brachypodium distachyon]|uniref:Uncharacterized protein n=1 Tax=Brachypodium distachyon TaxID=15368 RepID=A0A0Q3HJL4_BRADI|nr:uncharacterized protein LOC100845520 [Brachypodium distachyon]KQJ88507.1 hypothetical protein BRADI_4g19000v3 [Brachypodium distachyon]|eukprot:XP_003576043.1 uncharacterized protein LOC100845520 [Brachypodium distachyon]
MGKGKVHPSPPAPVETTAEGVLLRLLPAAVFAMAAPLGAGGKEVLAYLVLASLRSSSAPPTPAREESAARRPPHGPELGCGCFECYTAYWSRWDGSPESDREAIHRAIEAFDEHLARQEEGKGNRRRKKRAAAKDKPGKGKGKASAAVSPLPPPILPEQQEASSSSAVAVLTKDISVGEEQKTVEEEATAAVGLSDGDGVQEERRRRVWDAVAGVFNWRGWTLWGSH